MKIKDLLEIGDTKLLVGNEDEILGNISKDTRTISSGDAYLGLKGDNFDGNTFFEEALKKGAKTVIVSGVTIPKSILDKYKDRNIILTDDTENLIITLGIKKRKDIHVPIIAVTGSVGKTSTRNIIASVLESKYRVLKTKENLNTKIGLALTFIRYTDEEIIVLEMGMNHFGEIRELTHIALPDVAVITNIGTAHIGNLGSRENILKAKMEILEGLKGPIIVNNDNDLLNLWKQSAKIKNQIITYGIDSNSDYVAKKISYDKLGSHFVVKDNNVDINVIGKHFIYNSLVAFAIADLFDVPCEFVKEKLKSIPLEHDRMELISNKEYTVINDTYNASYDSIYYALDVLHSFPTRKIAVLGDILELGEFAEEIHKNIGKLIVNNDIDILITVGEYSKYVIESATKDGFEKDSAYHFMNNLEAIKLLKSILKENDTILIKASNSMHFKEIVNELI